jgi:hypothetical protein
MLAMAELRNGDSCWVSYFDIEEIVNPPNGWTLFDVWPEVIMEKTEDGLKPRWTDAAAVERNKLKSKLFGKVKKCLLTPLLWQ